MLSFTLNPDSTLTLSLNNESIHLTSEELDQRISELSAIRAQMQPGIPEEPPSIQEAVVNPLYAIRVDRVTRACLLRIRHPGLGWLNFEIPSQEIVNMKEVWSEIARRLELELHDAIQAPSDMPNNLH